MPLVSIIVPNYNHEKYLQNRFDSIFKQTYQNFEVLILDDFSTDNSTLIIEKYRNHPQVSKIIYNESNGGTSYKQWYKGIKYASGDLIWIAESDDWCNERFLESTINYFNDPEVTLVFVSTQFINPGEKPEIVSITGDFIRYSGIEFIRHEMLKGNKIPNASMSVFRKKTFEMVKDLGFQNMKLAGDWLLWIQMMNCNKIVFIPDQLNYCRKHNSNATNYYRALGYDFLEGLSVLQIGKQYCKNKYDRNETYLKWIDYLNIFKSEFKEGVLKKVLLEILKKEPKLFWFLLYKKCRTEVRKLVHIISQTQ